MRQLHGIMVRSAEPLPRFADAPEIAIVVFAAGEKKVPAIRCPLTGGLRGRLPSAGKNEMQTGTIGGHFPDRLGAILALVHVETNGFAVGRPGREVRQSRTMRQFAKLCPVGTDGIEAAAANINDLAAIRRPSGVVANGFANAPRLTALHGPEPQRHLIIAPGEPPDQKLRMVGREGEKPGVFKRSGHFFRVAAFHRSLHQIPVAAVMLEKKNPRAIGHDPAPFIDSSGVGNARHALHAGTGDGVHDEKEQPRTKGNRAGKKTEIDPPRRAPRHFPFPVKLGSPLRREFRIEAHADFDGLFRTLRRNTCPGRNGVG